jgi:hypothetical protein
MMAVRWTSARDGGASKAQRKERRSGRDRRADKDRRAGRDRRRQRRGIRDLYKTDLDRHLWSWARPGARKSGRAQDKSKGRRRTLASLVASAAGTLGAAGLSYYLWKRLREPEEPADPEHAQADLDEADFDYD